MWKVALRFGSLAAALALALYVGQFALFYRPSGTSTLLGAAAAVVLAAGYALGRTIVNRSARTRQSVDPDDLAERLESKGITSREYEVLELVAAGLSNREIADRLFIAETTVKSHVSSLLGKLDAHRRTEAVRIARAEGLLD